MFTSTRNAMDRPAAREGWNDDTRLQILEEFLDEEGKRDRTILERLNATCEDRSFSAPVKKKRAASPENKANTPQKSRAR
jgi:hypothetical protein